ncbi:MAG: hypothetical protein IJ833_05060 [Lachnospiraceae bacterium]|nr:hypothetical protein [Lachnospiraceae bacterium]
MRIVQESKRVLVNLYSTLSKSDEAAYEPGVEIHLSEYAKSINMTRENLNLYLWFLRDGGYITCDNVEYNEAEDATKKVYLTPMAIRMLESNDSI